MFAEGLPQARHMLSAESQQDRVRESIKCQPSLQVAGAIWHQFSYWEELCVSAMVKKTGAVHIVVRRLLKFL